MDGAVGVGTVLFDRASHPVQPTDLGRHVAEQGRVVLVEAQRLEGLIGAATGKLTGELRIGILSTLAPHLIPLTVAPFARRCPGAELVFEEMLADEIVGNSKRRFFFVTGRLEPGFLARGRAVAGAVAA